MSIINKAKDFLKKTFDSLSQTAEDCIYKPYDFYLIFGQNDKSNLPWVKADWDEKFEPYIDLLLKQTEHYTNTGIRATKYLAEKRIAKKDNKEFIYHSEVKMGRLRWDNKSHEKWTMLHHEDFYFQDLELWSPIWTVCEKRDSPPDIFMSIRNEDYFDKRPMAFGYFIVIAVAQNLKIDSKPIIHDLAEKINAKAAVFRSRRWGRPDKSGNWTFVNGIQDTFSNGIYKGYNIPCVDFSELDLEPFFEIVYKQK